MRGVGIGQGKQREKHRNVDNPFERFRLLYGASEVGGEAVEDIGREKDLAPAECAPDPFHVVGSMVVAEPYRKRHQACNRPDECRHRKHLRRQLESRRKLRREAPVALCGIL